MGRSKTSQASAVASETCLDSCLILIVHRMRDLAVWLVRRSSGQWCKVSARVAQRADQSPYSRLRDTVRHRDEHSARQDVYARPAMAAIARIGRVLCGNGTGGR